MHVFIRPAQKFLSCHACEGLVFAQREIKMTTTGMTFLDLDWLNKSGDGAVCIRCGYVHTFMAEAHQWVRPEDVRPADLPPDPHGDRPPSSPPSPPSPPVPPDPA